MEIIELTKKVLEECFPNYKDFHVFVLLVCYAVISAIFQIFQPIFINRKIERFSAELKKSEIKFSRYNKLQVEALKAIYEKLILFQSANFTLFGGKPDSISYEKFKSDLKYWVKTYDECMNEFVIRKILLPKNLKETVKTSITLFRQTREKLFTEILGLENIEQEDDNGSIYNFSNDELIDMQIRDGKARAMKIESWKQEIFAGNVKTQINLLKKEIEEHFEKMNS